RKLLDASDSARWMANLRPLVLERGGLKHVPSNGPVVVTRAAADILGEEGLPPGTTVLDYTFAADTRSEIIAIMLNAGNSRRRADRACPGGDRECDAITDAVMQCAGSSEPELPAGRAALREAARRFAKS